VIEAIVIFLSCFGIGVVAAIRIINSFWITRQVLIDTDYKRWLQINYLVYVQIT